MSVDPTIRIVIDSICGEGDSPTVELDRITKLLDIALAEWAVDAVVERRMDGYLRFSGGSSRPEQMTRCRVEVKVEI